LIIIPNQNLFRVANDKTTFHQAFQLADQVLHSGVRGVTDLMVMPGLINLDFADVRSVMGEMGKAMMGTGEASGERRALEAATKAINNPLLEDMSLKGARGVLINITGGYDMTLFELDEAANHIRQEVDPDANIIVGSTFDETLEGVMRVSVVATGIEADAVAAPRPQTNSFFTNVPPASQASANGPTVVRVNNGREPQIHQPTAQPAYQQPVAAPVPAPAPVYAQQAAPQPVQQPLFQQPVAPINEPAVAAAPYEAPAAAIAQPAAQPDAQRAAYQTSQPRPAMYAPANAPVRAAAPAPQRVSQAEELRPQREPARGGFNGFNIFGRPKPAAREEDWEERPEVNTRSLTQTQPLFGDEFDDEIEIPTFLRKQAN
jgi:cell division protein FtsZ